MKFDRNNLQWSTLVSVSSKNLFSLFFFDSQSGFVVGEFETILKTDDDGLSWSAYEPSHYNKMYDITFVNENIGFIGSEDGFIFKTMDGGEIWDYSKSMVFNDIKSICFIDENTGFATVYGVADNNDRIIKTIDGGETWSEVFSHEHKLFSISCNNTGTGFSTGGAGGTIIYTGDGGETWKIYPALCGRWLNAIAFTNNNRGYFTGSDGVIITTHEQEFLTSVHDIITHIPQLKTYPNPAKDFINIEIPENLNDASIMIFDLTGQKVLEFKIQNKKEFTIDVNELIPGLYIINIENSTEYYT